MNSLIKLISTFFYSGYLPKMPGTFGTLAALILYYFLANFLNLTLWEIFFITIFLIIISIISSHYSIKLFKSKDPNIVVIDEVAGYFVSLLFIPYSIGNLLCAFVLFRLFDIWKPVFVKKAESLHGGLGITLDDVSAGICANIILRIIIF